MSHPLIKCDLILILNKQLPLKNIVYISQTVNEVWKTGFTCLLIAIFAGSCSKNLPRCRGNCDQVSFSGNVTDFTSGQPIGNQTIEVTLKEKVYCMFCSGYDVAKGITDGNGHFEFKKIFDTSLLRDYNIQVQLTTTESYITRIAPADSSVGFLYPRTRVFGYYTIDSSLNNIQFKIYQKTPLRVNLHRTTAVISGREFFDLQYGFIGAENIGTAFIMNGVNKDTTVIINTAANVFTKINTGKWVTYDSLLNRTDSIKCSINGNNSIDISY